MPGGDGTGPQGLGPMTGRGAGYCAGFDTPGYANPVPRRYPRYTAVSYERPYEYYPSRISPVYPARGFGLGRGRGRGRMRWYR